MARKNRANLIHRVRTGVLGIESNSWLGGWAKGAFHGDHNSKGDPTVCLNAAIMRAERELMAADGDTDESPENESFDTQPATPDGFVSTLWMAKVIYDLYGQDMYDNGLINYPSWDAYREHHMQHHDETDLELLATGAFRYQQHYYEDVEGEDAGARQARRAFEAHAGNLHAGCRDVIIHFNDSEGVTEDDVAKVLRQVEDEMFEDWVAKGGMLVTSAAGERTAE